MYDVSYKALHSSAWVCEQQWAWRIRYLATSPNNSFIAFLTEIVYSRFAQIDWNHTLTMIRDPFQRLIGLSVPIRVCLDIPMQQRNAIGASIAGSQHVLAPINGMMKYPHLFASLSQRVYMPR